MGNKSFYKNPKYIEKLREQKLGIKNPRWKGGISKPFIKGQGKTRMLQKDYLNSNINPFIKQKWRFGTKNKGNKRPDLVSRNKDPEITKKRVIGIKRTLKKQGSTFEKLNKDINFIKKRLKGLMKKPTKPENILLKLINKNNLPYKYVGDGEIIIGRKCPDFINTNGQKKIIELFGDYWHNNKNTNWKQTEFGTKAIYSQYGFKTLIIWEFELNDLNKVLNEIIKFDGGD